MLSAAALFLRHSPHISKCKPAKFNVQSCKLVAICIETSVAMWEGIHATASVSRATLAVAVAVLQANGEACPPLLVPQRGYIWEGANGSMEPPPN